MINISYFSAFLGRVDSVFDFNDEGIKNLGVQSIGSPIMILKKGKIYETASFLSKQIVSRDSYLIALATEPI